LRHNPASINSSDGGLARRRGLPKGTFPEEVFQMLQKRVLGRTRRFKRSSGGDEDFHHSPQRRKTQGKNSLGRESKKFVERRKLRSVLEGKRAWEDLGKTRIPRVLRNHCSNLDLKAF